MSFLFGGNNDVLQDIKDEKALKHLQLINDTQFLNKEVTLIEVKLLDRIKKSENGKTILKDIDEKDIRAHLTEAKQLIAKAVNTYGTELAHLKEIVSSWSFTLDETSNHNNNELKKSSKSSSISPDTKLLYNLQQMKDTLSLDLLLISYCSTNQTIGIDDTLLPGQREFSELELLENLKHPKHGLDIKNRKYLLKTYENCFVGREAVDWMMDRKYSASRHEAVNILNRFVKFNEIAHVLNEHDFKDDYLFYRFVEPTTQRTVSQSHFSSVPQSNTEQAVLQKALKYGSCLDWWSNEVKEHVFTVILFISFDGSLFSKSMLKSWNQLVDDIHDLDGEIYGVTSDPQTAADNAKSEWKLRFDILSDPLNTLAANHAHITKSGSTGGIAHPGVMVASKFGRVVYEWYVNPHLERLSVQLATPSAADSWLKIQQAIKSAK